MNRWRRFTAVLVILPLVLPLAFAQPKYGKGGEGQSSDQDAGASGILKQDFTNYRGQRKPVERGDLYMESFVSEYDGTTLTIDIGFNQGIDPRSVRGEHILINDLPVNGPLKLSFNKEGTLLRLVIAGQVSIPYSFSISGIRSYNGKELDEGGLDGVGKKDSFCYESEKGLWQRR